MTIIVSVGIAVVVLGGLAAFILMQQRHDSKLVDQLRPLLGQPVTLGINMGNSQSSVAVFEAALNDVDSRTRWVTFQRLNVDLDATRSDPAGLEAMAATFLDQGVLADRIAWVEPDGADRLDLN